MKTWVKIAAVAGAVITVGAAVFLVSRPAAAAAAGRKAFKISADCLTVEVVDVEAGRAAIEAAAPIAFRSMDERAELLLLRILSYITDCPVSDAMKLTGIPGVPFGITVGQVRAILGDRTVGEVAELAAKGELPGLPGLEGASADAPPPKNPVNALLAWATGGDY